VRDKEKQMGINRKQFAQSLASKQGHYTRRIITAWKAAKPEHLEQGLAWYDRAQQAALGMHENLLISAGVIAALSPRTEWTINKQWAQTVISYAQIGRQYPPKVSTKQRLDKAWTIANLVNPTKEEILAILNGPKTQRFFLNIIGDLQAVTIDIWAQRVATGRHSSRPPRGKHYDALERAYRKAANLLGAPPRDVQAAVWVWVRGSEEGRVKSTESSWQSRANGIAEVEL
jgi:hypothetical protein